ncbi:MAG TPA: hypothetical protein VFE19_14535 [Jatrophihabitantaceae bacterium]|jgi:hypothetical protein|nr:hypothetical protein [Jatrophihabitantaceae bacterium]
MPDYESDEHAMQTLVREFPMVSCRVLAEVLAAYLRSKPTLTEAVAAAHDRIADACAM